LAGHCIDTAEDTEDEAVGMANVDDEIGELRRQVFQLWPHIKTEQAL
jgi:hypothetical protein